MFTIAIHGGAGSLTRATTTQQEEEEYKKGLDAALQAGYAVLERGGSAVEAVEKSVMALEDNPLFNAGRGSVLTAEGKNEADAAIMCGKTLEAGAVACINHIRNPISLARAVMEKSSNVLLTSNGAIDFAEAHGLSFEDDAYFHTERRQKELMKAQEKEDGKNTGKGTVGAVALDQSGNVAVATSTGGITNKKFGRVGDSPVIGGGTYASNESCAVSCTGDGEFFIRLVTAYDVAALVQYKNLELHAACQTAIDKLTALGGEGGLIAVNAKGNVELVFNCESMLRAWKNHLGEGKTLVWSGSE
jgi:L-asparaginase / beta-aspartyl-peptidase